MPHPHEKRDRHALRRQLGSSAQSLTGRQEEGTGRASEDRRLKGMGRRQQAGGNRERVGEKTKDTYGP